MLWLVSIYFEFLNILIENAACFGVIPYSCGRCSCKRSWQRSRERVRFTAYQHQYQLVIKQMYWVFPCCAMLCVSSSCVRACAVECTSLVETLTTHWISAAEASCVCRSVYVAVMFPWRASYKHMQPIQLWLATTSSKSNVFCAKTRQLSWAEERQTSLGEGRWSG